jgi:hypothetical protein
MSIRSEVAKVLERYIKFDGTLSNAQATSAIIKIIRNTELLEVLKLILPMAKGYAYKNDVGSNMKYIAIAEKVIADFEKMLEEEK